MPVEETEITEMYDIQPTRLDAVMNPANGVPFLAMKALILDELDTAAEALKAELSGKAMNDLPDSAFAYIEPGGKKDDEGKTTPRSLRHFPVHDAAHARNALARAPQSPFGDKAMPKIKAAAKKFGIEVSASKATDGSKCSTCDGTGKIKDGNMTCPDCDGSGKMAAKSMVYGVNTGDASMGTPTPTEAADGSSPMMPGSSAWEKQDADNLIAAGQLLAQAASMISCAQSREQMEVATGGGMNDVIDVQNLGQALYYAQQALGLVGFTAFTEENESMMAAQMESASKSQTLTERRATLRQTIEIARKAMSSGVTLTDSAAAGPTTEVVDMEMTKEEFDTAVAAAAKSAVEAVVPDAIATGLAKYEADRAAKKAAKAAATTSTEVTTGDAGATGIPAVTTAPAGDAAAKSEDPVLSALAGIAAKQAELETKVDLIGNATAKKAITSAHAVGLALRGQEGVLSENEAKKSELKDAIVKETDPTKNAHLREQLGRIELRERELAAGAFS